MPEPTKNQSAGDVEEQIDRLAAGAHEGFMKVPALEQLAGLVGPWLIEQLRRGGMTSERARDAVQETLAQLARLVARYTPAKKFVALLQTVVRRRLDDLNRGVGTRRLGDELPDDLDAGQSPERQAIDRETREAILRRLPGCWGRLESDQQQLLRDRYPDLGTTEPATNDDFDTFCRIWVERRTVEQILKLRGLPGGEANSIRSKLFRAHRELLTCLGVYPR